MASVHCSERLIRKLSSIAQLTDDDVAALRTLPIRATSVPADRDIVTEGDRPTRSCVILEGFACRYKLTPPGKRQILSFHMAGDVPDLQSLHLPRMDHSLATMTAASVGFIEHVDLRKLLVEQPTLTTAFWRETLIDAGIFREWMTGLGRRDAVGRLAHLFCELSHKMRAVNLANAERFPMPMTQVELGDALGLSTVHVNRTLSELRERGLVATEHGYVNILNFEALCLTGEFDPAYLHLAQ